MNWGDLFDYASEYGTDLATVCDTLRERRDGG